MAEEMTSGGMGSGALPHEHQQHQPHDDPQTLLLDALDEVHTRFVLNVPDSELERADRILFQIEQAWWFYEDFMVDASRPKLEGVATDDAAAPAPAVLGDPLLPSMNFRQFAEKLFDYSPLLDTAKFPSMWAQFSAYRKKIGTYGCILLSRDRKHVILVQLWNSKTHMFPSGKINQGESAVEAAIRETYEETGFDVSCREGLTAEWKESMPTQVTWPTTLTDANVLTYQEDSGKRRTCYVVPNVPMDFPFGAIARKEVSKIAWHPIDNIPRHSVAVVPFLSQLKGWLRGSTASAHKGGRKSTPKRDGSNPKSQQRGSKSGGTTPGRNRPRSRSHGSNGSDPGVDRDKLVASGLAELGDDCRGWSEEDMFRTNEMLLGRKVTYDGNPHAFGEAAATFASAASASGTGPAVVDPHSFRIVGGTFLNSPSVDDGSGGGIRSLAPAPEASRLQPLFLSFGNDNTEEPEFQPFFSDDGVTPWGEIVKDARGQDDRSTIAPPMTTPLQGSGQDLLKLLQPQPSKTGTDSTSTGRAGTSRSRRKNRADDGLPTDAQITAQSQREKTKSLHQQRSAGGGTTTTKHGSAQKPTSSVRDRILAQYEADMAYIRDWVAKLPRPPPPAANASPGGS